MQVPDIIQLNRVWVLLFEVIEGALQSERSFEKLADFKQIPTELAVVCTIMYVQLTTR